MNYWLFKTEPETYSLDDLKNEPEQTTHWEGIRNYTARNYLRDQAKKGDLVLIYHSAAKPPQIVGTAKVVREAYPDHFAFDPKSPYFDPKSDPQNPRWVMVDIQYAGHFKRPVTLDEIKKTPELAGMVLLKIGRLSISPVTRAEWEIIHKLGNG